MKRGHLLHILVIFQKEKHMQLQNGFSLRIPWGAIIHNWIAQDSCSGVRTIFLFFKPSISLNETISDSSSPKSFSWQKDGFSFGQRSIPSQKRERCNRIFQNIFSKILSIEQFFAHVHFSLRSESFRTSERSFAKMIIEVCSGTNLDLILRTEFLLQKW